MDTALALAIIGILGGIFLIATSIIQYTDKKKAEIKAIEIAKKEQKVKDEAKETADKLISLQEKNLEKADELNKANQVIINLNNELNNQQKELLNQSTGGGNFPIICFNIWHYAIFSNRYLVSRITIDVANTSDYSLQDVRLQIRGDTPPGFMAKCFDDEIAQNQFLKHFETIDNKELKIGSLPPKKGKTNCIYQALLCPQFTKDSRYWVVVTWSQGKIEACVDLHAGENEVDFKDASIILNGKQEDYKNYIKIEVD